MTRLRMPAEWEPHEATWLAWPHERSDWPGKFAPIPFLYGEIVRILSRREAVHIIARPEDLLSAQRICRRANATVDSVFFHTAPNNRSWTRDYCPLFVHNQAGRVQATKWRFNGWAKYDNWSADDDAGERVAEWAGVPLLKPTVRGQRVVLEGGSIDVNGAGALLTTEECLLSPIQARNPQLSRQQMEALMSRYLGIGRVIWLNQGITGDDTHGHVDDLARFTSDDTVVIAAEDDPADPNYAPLRENYRLLKSAVRRVVQLPMPRPVMYHNQRLPASYANFYVANGVVLVPLFHDPADRIAVNTLSKLFPNRDVIGIYAVDLVLGLGTLHCMTMQQPARRA